MILNLRRVPDSRMPPGAVAQIARSRAARLGLALTLGILAGIYAYACFRHRREYASDLEFWWRGTRIWVAGGNPYALRPGEPGWPLYTVLQYPLPALMIFSPLQGFGLAIAAALFMGVSTALLAWILASDGYWRLLLFAGPGFYMAVALGQWTPLLIAGALVPSAGFLLAAKPTLGVAYFAYRPTWRGALGVAAISAFSLALWPAWPVHWIHNLHLATPHPIPAATPVGALIALAALTRWRQPEARLLIAMTCVPQTALFADQLVLGLTARTRMEMLLFSVAALAVEAVWLVRVPPSTHYVGESVPYVFAGAYVPALLLVLRRPNTGALPVWLRGLGTEIRLRFVRQWHRAGT